MLRSLIIVAAIILVFLLIKNRLRNKTPSRSESKTGSDTVMCKQCNTYIPADEAFTEDDNFFCCRQHQRDWMDKQNRDG